MSKTAQMTFNFEPGISSKFPTVRRYIEERIAKGPKMKEYVAADMNQSPSDLTRRLTQNVNDKRTFGTDHLDAYMESQNDYSPILWYIDKYGRHLMSMQDAEIKDQIAKLQQLLSAKDSGQA